MKGITMPRVGLVLIWLGVCSGATAQTDLGPGNPDWNVNIVGPTKNPAHIRDLGLRQQNEPACAIRPGDSSCIICAYNDYRTLDKPEIGDGWQGVSMSCDAGKTWFSRVATGHAASLAPIDARFAADPRLTAIPGMAILNFIGGYRGENRGVLAIQHWPEINQEDANYYEPAQNTIIAETGTDGRFVDKPDMLGVIAQGNKAGTVTLTHVMENPALGTITRTYPAGKLYLAYAVFTGSQSVKLLVKVSDDWGQTWNNQSTKLTESQNLVSGVTMTHKAGNVLAVWRQAGDNNDTDALYYSITTNEGKAWSKPAVLTNICAFDQTSSTTASADSANKLGERVTFRTNDFPWVATDGVNYYMFYSDRKTGTGAACDGTGVAKLYMRYSANGSSWSAPIAIDNSPESALGYQFMPAAFGANGKVQVAWYDTRRENILDPTLNTIADYSPDGFSVVNRKIDVYTAKVAVVGGAVTVSPSTRVSQFRTIFDSAEPAGPLGPTLYEAEASFGNAMLYGSGYLAFLGDYIAVAGQEYRRDGSGGWTSNFPAASPIPEANKADFYIAWADHRDIRGDVLYGSPGSPPTEYTPPENVGPPVAGELRPAFDPDDFEDYEEYEEALERSLLATNREPATALPETDHERQSTEGVEDAPADPFGTCVIQQDRTRDANIYGALVRDERLRMSLPTQSKPLNSIQRAFPVALTNVNPEPLSYRLYIASQPAGSTAFNRASFRQQPSIPPFATPPTLAERIENLSIPANSTFARTAFVNASDPAATVRINAYDGACAATTNDPTGQYTEGFLTACPVLATITLGGTGATGTLYQPDYDSGVCDGAPTGSTCYEDVLLAELHNPLLENPLLENPLLENPLLENPLLENPLLENPLLENPLLENPLLENPLLENYGFANPLLENPLLENPLLENPLLENPLLENPLLENPLLENPLLENAAPGDGVYYMDVTAAIKNDGNVTTAYSADLTVTSSMTDPNYASQLIAWTQYVTPTARDCQVRAQVENQVLAVKQNPDAVLSVANINQPFEGEVSFIAAPGQTVFVTHRIFGTAAQLQAISISGFTASSQAANCIDNDGTVGEDYFCETSLRENNEKILLDTVGPVFSLNNGDVVPVPAQPANVPGDPATGEVGGACIDLVGSGLVTATDESLFTISCSLASAPNVQLCTSSDPLAGLSIQASTLTSPGPTLVNCTATDEAGNSTSIQIGVDVQDNDAPYFTAYPTMDVHAQADDLTGNASLDVYSLVDAVDAGLIDPSPVVGCDASPYVDLTAGQLFIGSYGITCTATDASGNVSGPVMFNVIVDDVTAPVLSNVPGNITVAADDASGAVVSYLVPSATDNSGSAIVVCVPPPGSLFAIGTTTVSCSATDPTGNTSLASFTVDVTDNIAPTLSLPGDITVSAGTDPAGAVVTYSASASDNAGSASLECTPASGSVFPYGTTTVNCTATDAAGNTASGSFNVTVDDDTAPVISGAQDIDVTTFTMSADVDYSAGITATDAVDGARPVTCTRDDDPTSSSTIFGYGSWGITCTAADSQGNVATAGFNVNVAFAYGIKLTIPKGNITAGSTVPLDWQYLDPTTGLPVASGFIMPSVKWRGPFANRSCSGLPGNVDGEDSGSSGFRYSDSQMTWQYSWQTPGTTGSYVVTITPPGTPLGTPASACVALK